MRQKFQMDESKGVALAVAISAASEISDTAVALVINNLASLYDVHPTSIVLSNDPKDPFYFTAVPASVKYDAYVDSEFTGTISNELAAPGYVNNLRKELLKKASIIIMDKLLKEAAEAHHVYEAKHPEEDHSNWARWYADYMITNNLELFSLER